MKIKINLKTVPLYILLIVGCLRWLFEGIIGGYILQIIILIIGLIILFYANRITQKHIYPEWILFLAGIFISMIFGSTLSSYSTLIRFIYVSLIVLYAIFCNYKPEQCKNCIRFIIVAAIVYSVLIIIQYFMGEEFNNMLFPYLNEKSLVVAESYYNNGYIYGIFFTPADPAGLLVFTISFLVLVGVMEYRTDSSALSRINLSWQIKRTRTWILAILLLVPMLLTGKRGVLVCGIASLAVILALHYINKGQWYKVVAIIVALIAAFLIFVYLLIRYPNNPLFHRFIQLFNSYTEGGLQGSIDDSGRGVLYRFAAELWFDNKLFGIGWRRFSDMTVSVYGFSRAHEVNNEYLQFLCETGIVGTILILTPMLITLRITIIVCLHYEKISGVSAEAKHMAYAASFIQFFILIYAIIETPFCDMMYFTIYIFSVIVINGCYKQVRQNQSTTREIKTHQGR